MYNVESYEPYLLYWVNNVSGLQGFFTGKKIKEITGTYFTFEYISNDRKSRGYRVTVPNEDYVETRYNAELIIRLTVYGENCNSKITLIENTLFGEDVPKYLKINGLNFAKSSNIRFSNDFNITEFLPQAQVDLTFNITLSTLENSDWIESADLTVEEYVET